MPEDPAVVIAAVTAVWFMTLLPLVGAAVTFNELNVISESTAVTVDSTAPRPSHLITAS